MLSLLRTRLQTPATRFLRFAAPTAQQKGVTYIQQSRTQSLLAQVLQARAFASNSVVRSPAAAASSKAKVKKTTGRSTTKTTKKKPATKKAAPKKKKKTIAVKKKKTTAKKAAPRVHTKSGLTREEQKLLKAPKKPGSAYNIFVGKFVKASTLPKDTLESTSKIFPEAASVWKSLSDFEKQPFQNEHQERVAAYKKELAAWSERVIQNKVIHDKLNRYNAKKGKRVAHLPPEFRRPATGYVRYSAKESASMDGPIPEKAKEISKRWKALSASERAVYNDAYKADYAKWKKEHGLSS